MSGALIGHWGQTHPSAVGGTPSRPVGVRSGAEAASGAVAAGSSAHLGDLVCVLGSLERQPRHFAARCSWLAMLLILLL